MLHFQYLITTSYSGLTSTKLHTSKTPVHIATAHLATLLLGTRPTLTHLLLLGGLGQGRGVPILSTSLPQGRGGGYTNPPYLVSPGAGEGEKWGGGCTNSPISPTLPQGKGEEASFPSSLPQGQGRAGCGRERGRRLICRKAIAKEWSM